MRFLVVDDSSTMRRIIINTLNKLGYTECREAGNGKEGLDALSANPVDIVITDWNMPEMTGIELAQAINEKKLGIPFAFITSECTTQMRDQANAAGAVAFLTKPFTAETMQSALGKVLE